MIIWWVVAAKNRELKKSLSAALFYAKIVTILSFFSQRYAILFLYLYQ
jgi:hypothetical protein